MNPVDLVIAIPTYNRAKHLETLLTRIASQLVVKRLANISILVIDNCSTDGTPGVISKAKTKWPVIEAIRHRENVGPINNFVYAIRYVKARYVQLLSDDDYLLDSYFDKLDHMVRGPEFNIAHLPSIGVKHQDEFKRLPHFFCSKTVREYDSGSDLILDCCEKITLISAFILSAAKAKKYCNFDYYSEVNFANIIINMSKEPGRFITSDYSMVAKKVDVVSCEIFPQLFIEHLPNFIEKNFCEINQEAYKKYITKYVLGYLPSQLFFEINANKAHGERLIEKIREIYSGPKWVFNLLIYSLSGQNEGFERQIKKLIIFTLRFYFINKSLVVPKLYTLLVSKKILK